MDGRRGMFVARMKEKWLRDGGELGGYLFGELADLLDGFEEGAFPAVGGVGDVDADLGVADVDVVAEVAAEGLSCAADAVAQAEDDGAVVPVY